MDVFHRIYSLEAGKLEEDYRKCEGSLTSIK